MTIIDNLENETNKSDNTDNDAAFDEDYLHISEDSPGVSGNEATTTIVEMSLNKSSLPKTTTRTVTTTTTTTTSGHEIPITHLHHTHLPSKPKFLKLFESGSIKEGNVLLLTCQVVGEPKPELVWQKDGQTLKNNPRVCINYLPNGASSLYVESAYPDDAGSYQVTATNEHGIAVYIADIEIEGKLITILIN